MRRIGAVAIIVGSFWAALTPGFAAGAVTIGQTGTPSACFDNSAWVPETDLAIYTAPSNGVITSWSTTGGITAGRTLKFLVQEPRGGSVYATVQKDAIARTITTNVVNAFQVRIPIQAGEVLGLFVPDGQPDDLSVCAIAGPGTLRTSTMLGEPALGAPVDFDDPRAGRLNVSAVLEPDADCDGFGDETQDQDVNRRCVATLLNARVKGTQLQLSLSCPLLTQACDNNQVSLKTAKKVNPARLAASAKAKRITLGNASVSIPAGGSLTVTRKLGRLARSLFAVRSKVKAQVAIAAGAITSTQTLKVKRK